MARRRMIDPNLWTSEDVGKLTMLQRLLMIGMFSQADDYGKGRAHVAYLRSVIFPYDDISLMEIQKALEAIAACIHIKIYKVEGNSYYKFTKWEKWQNVQKPQPSRIPDPEEDLENMIQATEAEETTAGVTAGVTAEATATAEVADEGEIRVILEEVREKELADVMNRALEVVVEDGYSDRYSNRYSSRYSDDYGYEDSDNDIGEGQNCSEGKGEGFS